MIYSGFCYGVGRGGEAHKAGGISQRFKRLCFTQSKQASHTRYKPLGDAISCLNLDDDKLESFIHQVDFS